MSEYNRDDERDGRRPYRGRRSDDGGPGSRNEKRDGAEGSRGSYDAGRSRDGANRAGGSDGRRSFGDRSERRPYGERGPQGSREHGSYGGRGDRPQSGERRPYGDRGERRPYGERGERGSQGSGERRPYGGRGDRPQSGERRPYGDRGEHGGQGSGERRSYADRGDRRDGAPRGGERRDGTRGSFGDRRGPRDGARRPTGGRDGGRQGAYVRGDDRRSGGDRERRAPRPDRPRDPEIPDEITPDMLDRKVRGALRGLTKHWADATARHLVMAGRLLDDDPELAYAHSQAAVRRASRIDVVREAAAITAYATGRYGEALREVRTVRRLSGIDAHRPLEADCERGLGRPERALAVVAETDRSAIDARQWVELSLVAAGARGDLGQHEAGLLMLEDPIVASVADPAVRYRIDSVRADLLEALGRTDEAAELRAASPAPLDETEDDIVVFDLLDEDEDAGTIADDEARDEELSDDDPHDEPSSDEAPSDARPAGDDIADDAATAPEQPTPGSSDAQAAEDGSPRESDAADNGADGTAEQPTEENR